MWNQLKTLVLLGALSALLVGAGALLGPGYLAGFTALALGLNLLAWFFSDRLVLRLAGARELPVAEAPELHAIVQELAARAGIPKPRVHVVPGLHANAFATGRGPGRAAVAVTEGLLLLLDRRELRGVLAHELAHVANRDVLVATVAAGLAGAIAYVGHGLIFGALLGGRDEDGAPDGHAGGGLLFALAAPFAATLVQLGISRSREFLADETGARISGDPIALARALAKLHAAADEVPAEAAPATASLFIVNPFGGAGAALARLFSTHPPAKERIARLYALARRTGAHAFDPATTPRALVR